ncbi:MAG: YbjQ family protein [Burkholderiales bacterium]|nr:YbjQ family protein [Burkholderiales bacterium]
MLVTTMNDVPGKQIVEVLGVVHGIIVRTPTITQGFIGNLKNILGGHNQAFTDMCEQTRNHAYEKMIEHANSLGANAIIAMRYDSDSVGGDQTRANEVFCYGTAVIIK